MLLFMETKQTKAAKVEGRNFLTITHKFNDFVKECNDTHRDSCNDCKGGKYE